MQRFAAGAAVALITMFNLSTTAIAAPNAEDAMKYRHAVMEEMAAHMSALTLILFDKVDGAAYAQGHADALARALDELDVLFPEVSRDGDTHALPVVWDNPEKFAEAVEDAQSKASALQAAMGGDDRKATLEAFAATGKSCKGCHEVYRAEDDDSDSHSH